MNIVVNSDGWFDIEDEDGKPLYTDLTKREEAESILADHLNGIPHFLTEDGLGYQREW